jgi:carboxyl-terminal processing protease
MEEEGVPAGNTAQREVRYTDNKRKVYGGGGITPDIIEPLRDPNHFEMLLASKDVFFQYARRLTSGEVPNAKNFQLPIKGEEVKDSQEKTTGAVIKYDITNAILVDFKQFLRDRNIEFSNEDVESNVDFIKRRIRQEVFTSSFGIQEGFKIGIQGDTQVLKALELMPEAKFLMTSGRLEPSVKNP